MLRNLGFIFRQQASLTMLPFILASYVHVKPIVLTRARLVFSLVLVKAIGVM